MKSLTPKEFIRACYAAKSVIELSKRLGITPNAVSGRISLFKKHGVKMPVYRPASAHGYDWENLREYARMMAASRRNR